MELTKEEEASLKGENGESLQIAYRILVATGEATDAEKLIPIEWAHVSGVNYNTIGDAGEEFLSSLSKDAKVKVKTTVNPMGYDIDNVSNYNLDEEFIKKQESIRDSYNKMGVTPSFSCIPYEIFDLPKNDTQVSFAETNAAIYVNSIAHLKTNKESAFSALASALTGKSPYSDLRKDQQSPNLTIRMKLENPNELELGMLGYFAGKVADSSVRISGVNKMDRRSCKSLCGGMGTSGTCGKFILDEGNDSEKVDFDKTEMKNVYDELNTTDSSDLITLGSPQLGLEELADLSSMLKGKSFKKRCMVFCPRTIHDQAKKLGYTGELERAGCEILSDCCTCLTPLIDKKNVDGVTTNSIKGAYYLKNSNGVDVNLKPLSKIIQEETK
ncbi:MAG: aconitase X catalytic domain-containing protein [Nitrosopumilus sp.]